MEALAVNELDRRDLLRAFLGAPALWAAGCASRRGQRSIGDIDGGFALRRERLGHRMRDLESVPEPTSWTEVDVAIVGGGVAGLSCMRALRAGGIRNAMLLELDARIGGTAQGGTMPASAHPWGAHYVTVPMASNKPLISLLQEVGAVEEVLPSGEPVMAEQHLCTDPAERIFYRGRWYEGLYPIAGASPEERAQRQRFEDEVDRWVAFRDAHGRRAFSLPMSSCSDDERVRALDSMSMDIWMHKNGFTSPRLRWWVEYACRDDYGTTLADTSAWSVFFYFASRKQRPGADYQEVVTWPEGNARLVSHLRQNISPHASHAVVRVQNTDSGVSLVALDARDPDVPKVVGVRARYVIMATPQFINARIVQGLSEERLAATQSFEQSPWMVANLQLSARPTGAGFPLCWDNVLYDSPSLGYVVATHQSGPDRGPTVLTYYYPLTDSDATIARRRLLELDWKHWSEVVLSDLERAHPGLRNHVDRIDIARWGHGMVRSTPGRIWDGRLQLAAAPHGRIHFAHSDLSGVALFEEAFDQGNRAAGEVLTLFEGG